MNRIACIFIFSLLVGCASTTPKEEQTKETAPKLEASTATVIPLGTAAHPVSFYFTPSVDPDFIQTRGRVLISFLEQETGLKFKMNVPDHYQGIIDAFGDGEADVAIMSSLSYIMAREAYGVTAALKAVRYNQANYYGQIIAHVESGIENLEDIQGKSMVFTDSTSGSGYLYPKKMLQELGVKPLRVAFAYQHDRVVRMVYQGIADAGATYYSAPQSDGTIRDARAKLLEEYPDVADKVKIVAITDPIPNDPVVFSQSVDKETKFAISKALIKFVSSDEGREVMDELYSIQGYTKCADSEYDGLRAAVNG